MNKVVFISDIFRDRSFKFMTGMYLTLKAIFTRAFKVEFAPPYFAEERFTDFYNKYSEFSWQNIYNGMPEEMEKEYVSLIDMNAIHLSCEAPTWLYKLWQKYGIKYIDVRLSYLRFMPDIPVLFSTNIPSMIPVLREFKMKDDDIFFEADLLKGRIGQYVAPHRNFSRFRNSLVILGQLEADTSLMVEGKQECVKLQDYEERLKEICSQYENIYFKPHPYRKYTNGIIDEIRYFKQIVSSNVALARENFYDLAVQDFPIDFLALSSGSTREAYYFRKNGMSLMDFPFSYKEGEYFIKNVLIDATYFFSPKFWQICLSDVLPLSRVCEDFRKPISNIMREHHNMSWGFNEYYYFNNRNLKEMLTFGGVYSNINNLKDLCKLKKFIWKYRWQCILSVVSFGRLRRRAKKKKRELKERISKVRSFMREP